MKLVKIILIVFVALILYSCDKDDSNPIGPGLTQSGILPLKNGNVWNFTGTAYDSLGSITGTGSISANISKDTTIQAVSWFLHNPVILPSSVLFSNKDDGLWGFYTTDGSSALLFKYPASANDSYASLRIDDTMTMKVVATNVSVAVPAGTYSCYQYQATFGNDDAMNFFLAPGTGWVKIEMLMKRANGQSYVETKIELRSVSLK